MELYYEKGLSAYKMQIKGIKQYCKNKRTLKKFIKDYCSDYFSLAMNVISLTYFLVEILKNI